VRLASSPLKNLFAMKPKEYTARLKQRWQPGKRNKANDLRICTWNVVRKMKVKKWWLAARNRESWRNILREAKAHSGL
jgi:hypothetical protein